jgi:hypothetical protein
LALPPLVLCYLVSCQIVFALLAVSLVGSCVGSLVGERVGLRLVTAQIAGSNPVSDLVSNPTGNPTGCTIRRNLSALRRAIRHIPTDHDPSARRATLQLAACHPRAAPAVCSSRHFSGCRGLSTCRAASVLALLTSRALPANFLVAPYYRLAAPVVCSPS